MVLLNIVAYLITKMTGSWFDLLVGIPTSYLWIPLCAVYVVWFTILKLKKKTDVRDLVYFSIFIAINVWVVGYLFIYPLLISSSRGTIVY